MCTAVEGPDSRSLSNNTEAVVAAATVFFIVVAGTS